MRFSLLIQGGPTSSQAPDSALRFARAAVTSGHEICRAFFQMDGVLTALASSVPPQDELDIGSAWSHFATEHDVDLVICISSALRRGVLDADEANRYERVSAGLHAGFAVSGLGQLVDATLDADRVVTFS